MALYHWVGHTRDVSSAVNWTPSGGPPGAGDTAIVSPDFVEAYSTIDGGTLSGTLAAFVVTGKHSGRIGSLESPLNVDADHLHYDGSGGAYFAGDYTDTSVHSKDKSEPGLVLVSGDPGRCWIGNGLVTFESGVTGGTLYVGYDDNQLFDSHIVVKSTSVGTVYQNGGVTTYEAYGGSLWIEAGKAVFESGVGSITLYQMGGEVEYNGSNELNGSYIINGRFKTNPAAFPTSGTPLRIFEGADVDILDDYSGVSSMTVDEWVKIRAVVHLPGFTSSSLDAGFRR